LWNLGDSVAGDIHDELTITNEFPLPVQMVKAGEIYTIIARRLAGHCEKLTVRTFAGNHDRLFRKKQYKQRAENSAAFVVHNIMQKALDRQKNLELNLSTSDPDLINVNGWNFLAGHGDNVKGWSGHPWYGWDRADKKESFRRMNTDEGFHYRIFAHWHVPLWHMYRIGTGSFFGTNELDHASGRTSPPTQVAYLIHRKRGVFNMMQFNLDG
jgi:hypothetical protein